MKYRLNLNGILDRESAERLLQEVERRLDAGGREIELECSELEGALYSALEYAALGLARLKKEYPDVSRVIFLNPPAHILPLGSLFGWEVSGRDLVPFPEPPEAAPPSQGGYHRICRSCEAELRVRGPGNHACPHCGARFYADRRGRLSFYEALI